MKLLEKISDRVRSGVHWMSHRDHFTEREGVGDILVCSRRFSSVINLEVFPDDGGDFIELFDVNPEWIDILGECENSVDLRAVAENLALSYQ